MNDSLKKIIKHYLMTLQKDNLEDLGVISWSVPVLFFGNINNSRIATVGLNPSNLEFVDSTDVELVNNKRRFPTLNSLGISKPSDINDNHLSKILFDSLNYFSINPYDNWFKQLDYLLQPSRSSYYFPSFNACHLDLIPYATSKKWSSLKTTEQAILLELSKDITLDIIVNSQLKILILNGQTVVSNFMKEYQISFIKKVKDDWSLNRINSDDVKGFSYYASVDKILTKELKEPILILGYNHNIQSSFGVSKKVKKSIKNWITKKIEKNETSR